jgi:hypothetical protein
MLGQVCPEREVEDAELGVVLEVDVVVWACAGRTARRPTIAKIDSVATSQAPLLLVARLVFNSDSPPCAKGRLEYLEDFRDGSLIRPESLVNCHRIRINVLPTSSFHPA